MKEIYLGIRTSSGDERFEDLMVMAIEFEMRPNKLFFMFSKRHFAIISVGTAVHTYDTY